MVPQSSAVAIDCAVLIIHAMQIAFLILLLLVCIFLVQDLPANRPVLSLERLGLFLAKLCSFVERAPVELGRAWELSQDEFIWKKRKSLWGI